MNKIKIVFLIGEGDTSSLMFHGIKDCFNVERVIVEHPVSRAQLLKRRLKRLGLVRVVGQIIFGLFNKWLKEKSQKRITEIISIKNMNNKNIDSKLISRVESVND